MQILSLRSSHWHLDILPELGASVLGLRAASGRLVMRPVHLADIKTSSQCASFALLPFSNRIRGAAFDFAGRHIQLKPTTADGLTQHGDVRNRPWQVEANGEWGLQARFDSRHFADINWPWAFSAQMHYELRGAALEIRLSLTNESDSAMPAGMGLHPYFAVEQETTLQLLAQGWYQNDAQSLPLGAAVPLPAELNFAQPRALTGLKLDDVLQGWQGEARLQWPERTLTIRATPEFGHVVLFAAPDGSFALEPVSHATDAFNLAARGVSNTGMQVLEPGQTLSGTVTLEQAGEW